jgi:hypothetical protein
VRLISELKRRNVFRMAVLYIVTAWLVIQVVSALMDLGALPEWIGPWTLVVLAIGFPIAVAISWFFEVTPEGVALEKDVAEGEPLTRATGRRMDFIVIAILAAGLMLFAYDKWGPEGRIERSIAVLAFDNLGGGPDEEYFSDGIAEEILHRFSHSRSLRGSLRSTSRARMSTLRRLPSASPSAGCSREACGGTARRCVFRFNWSMRGIVL